MEYRKSVKAKGAEIAYNLYGMPVEWDTSVTYVK
jgi:hypothetical protein